MSRRVCEPAVGGCGQAFCSACLNHAFVPESEAEKGLDANIATTCKECYKKGCSLDHSVTQDIIGPAGGEAVSIVYAHGGGGCRTMFLEHAEAMVKLGYRCVLFDFPGHGARMDEPLSLESAIQTIVQTISMYAPPCKGIKPIYVGGSLGGYVGMEFLGRHSDMVSGAIITMCGQNVGVGRSFKAGAALKIGKMVMPRIGVATILKGLLGEIRKNGNIPASSVMSMALRTGMFFQQGRQQIEILLQTEPQPALRKVKIPVLFVNGSRDHRDSEQRWLESTEKGQLIVYDGADHFFSHDQRYAQRFVDDSAAFLAKTVQGTEAAAA